MSVNRAEREFMATLVEARGLLLQIAGPTDSKKEIVRICARKTQLSFNRCREILKLEPRVRVTADELEHLREKAHGAGSQTLLERLERLEAAMLQTDPEFYQPYVSAARAVRSEGGNES